MKKASVVLSAVLRLGLVSGAIGLTGCSGLGGLGPEARQPESGEKAVFEGVSAFYCAKKRWPISWDEILEFGELSEEAQTAVGEMLSPEIASPRAVLLIVRYKNIQGLDRKVTYIAPPECTPSDDPNFWSMAGGRVSFKTPPGFTPLDGRAIKEKWRGGPYPDAAWHDAAHGIFVTVSFSEVEVSSNELEGLKTELEETYESSLPAMRWIERTAALADEPPRLIHMLSSASAGGRTVTYALSMSFDDHLLTLSITAPEIAQPVLERAAAAIQRSLRVL
jgi:hypothetical protein